VAHPPKVFTLPVSASPQLFSDPCLPCAGAHASPRHSVRASKAVNVANVTMTTFQYRRRNGLADPA